MNNVIERLFGLVRPFNPPPGAGPCVVCLPGPRTWAGGQAAERRTTPNSPSSQTAWERWERAANRHRRAR